MWVCPCLNNGESCKPCRRLLFSSIGQFSIQLTVEVDNYSTDPVTPELLVVCMNSGSFATERGTSSTYTALLTKQDVLDASMQEAVPRGE